ncbi:MAG: uroporphyrinogen-III C-methyltransferase [Actinomycetota bacterium]
MSSGRVYLVGAGPGDPGLITARGLRLLRECDVVLYDRLVAPQLLDEAPAAAEMVFTGKTPGETHSRQVVIDALMIARAKEGKKVVRLKGGDPFVFGRGAEEAALLTDAGVEFEIVPGVTSAVAAPAYAGIPVTNRGMASSFAVMTGHSAETEEIAGSHVSADTVVLLMGVAQLRDATRRLIDGGREGTEPAAIVQWGTTSDQRVVVATLETIAQAAETERIGSPATTIAGKVVEMRKIVSWFESRPLFGHRVVVTRPRKQASELIESLEDAGANVIALPTIEIAAPEDPAPLRAAVEDAAAKRFDWILFSSVNAVESFFGALSMAGLDVRSLRDTKLAAVGDATARALGNRGIVADLMPQDPTSESLAVELGLGEGSVLLPRVEGGPRLLPDLLGEAGWTVTEVVAYRNVAPAPGRSTKVVQEGSFDVVTFASASSVRNFVSNVATPGEVGIGSDDTTEKKVVCIGPSTAAEAAALGMRVDATAQIHSSQGLLDAVITATHR